MKRDELPELHYIVAIENVPSILEKGILSNRRAEKVLHRSLAKEFVQDRRDKVVVENGRPLHEYANLYIHARNPTLRRMIGAVGHEEICVLKVSSDVLDLPNVVVTDQNAAAELKHVRFAAAPAGLSIVDKDMVLAESWIHPHPAATYRHKSVKCAEVLVPDQVDTGFILGAFVSCSESKQRLEQEADSLDVTLDGHLFFL